MNGYLFSILPLWATYTGIVFIILLSVKSGILYSNWRKKRIKNEDDGSINTIVGATLGLLAFILAFTFSLSTSRFDAQKQFLLEEINSIETSWLRAGLIEEPFSEQIQQALADYTKVRINLVENPKITQESLKKSEEIQSKIWSILTLLIKQNIGNDKINVLLIQSINDMFDYQTRRISKAYIDRIPYLIWIALFGLLIIAMFEVGYLLGKAEKSNWVLVLALSMAFSAIVIIIVDLDNSKGHIKINHKVLYDMYDRISI